MYITRIVLVPTRRLWCVCVESLRIIREAAMAM